eukprot:4403876-Pyramimonas_sp.AAC.1
MAFFCKTATLLATPALGQGRTAPSDAASHDGTIHHDPSADPSAGRFGGGATGACCPSSRRVAGRGGSFGRLMLLARRRWIRPKSVLARPEGGREGVGGEPGWLAGGPAVAF